MSRLFCYPLQVLLGLLVASWALPVAGAEPADPLVDTGGLFDAYRVFGAQSPPAVCIVVTQDPNEIREAVKKPDGMAKLLTFQSRVSEISRLPCLLVHSWNAVSPGAL